MKIWQIQRIKISKVILKSVKGLLKEVHLYVHASVKASGFQPCWDSVKCHTIHVFSYWLVVINVIEAIEHLSTCQLDCKEDMKIGSSVSRLWTRPVASNVNTIEEDQHVNWVEKIDLSLAWISLKKQRKNRRRTSQMKLRVQTATRRNLWKQNARKGNWFSHESKLRSVNVQKAIFLECSKH